MIINSTRKNPMPMYHFQKGRVLKNRFIQNNFYFSALWHCKSSGSSFLETKCSFRDKGKSPFWYYCFLQICLYLMMEFQGWLKTCPTYLKDHSRLAFFYNTFCFTMSEFHTLRKPYGF